MNISKFKDSLGNPWRFTQYHKKDFEHLLDYNEKFIKIFDKIKPEDKLLESINLKDGEEVVLVSNNNLLFFYYVETNCFDMARDLMEELAV